MLKEKKARFFSFYSYNIQFQSKVSKLSPEM
jgi:hypothetical protein